MESRNSPATILFDRIILRYPRAVIFCTAIVVVFLAVQARHFELDASADTLLLEGDGDLRFARKINAIYGRSDLLVITFTPEDDLFSDETLRTIGSLRDDLSSLERVESVLTILDIPLLESPPLSLADLKSELPTLESPVVDRREARKELSESPLFRDLLISADLRTTALLINFEGNEDLRELRLRRDELLDLRDVGTITTAQRAELDRVSARCEQLKDKVAAYRHQDIAAIREIMDNYRDRGEMFLGGVSMIADDLITFIKDDLKVFGMGVMLFMILTLTVIFKRVRWVILPVLCCAVAVLCAVGLLGWFGWEVTVISSNFISLQLVITMAISIHLVVGYRELLTRMPTLDNRSLVLQTMTLKARPCTYAVLTTIAGFASLVFCNILPVIMFGYMMTAALLISLVISFLLFPTILVLLPKDAPPSPERWHVSVTGVLARATESGAIYIFLLSGLVLVLSVAGFTKLRVENSFIDYFKERTEIYQGMKVIDRQLGGTTPLDVIVDFEPPGESDENEQSTEAGPDAGVFDEFDLLEEPVDKEKYWFTADKMERIEEVHNYLDSLPETGKVMSLVTLAGVVENLKQGEPLDSLELALLYNETPERFRKTLVNPYVSVEHGQVRFWVRVRDSEENLRRNELINRIRSDLVNDLGFEPENVHLSGMLVLYNNMLQSLFHSQITTLGITVLILTGMFFVLFRSVRIALVAMIPNILSVGTVLGVMGWLNIPLDIATITIAAISVGIAVDDNIHYIDRFKYEFEKDRDYLCTMRRCHASIGRAMYYTSITIIVGFSILALSNFVPGVYFGLLTGLAMLIALLADLTLLPRLLMLVKPFGKEYQERS